MPFEGITCVAALMRRRREAGPAQFAYCESCQVGNQAALSFFCGCVAGVPALRLSMSLRAEAMFDSGCMAILRIS